MDYSKIMADPLVGKTIGRLYLDAPSVITPQVREAYGRFVEQVDWQYDLLTRPASSGGYGVSVTFTDDDPYADADTLFGDIRSGAFRVYRTQGDQSHPLLSRAQNDRFRAVHDYFGHFCSGRGFDRHGEEAAWVCHSRMFTGLAARAMTTETRGQSSAFIWINGGREFPEQKACLLPEWVSTVPLKWLV